MLKSVVRFVSRRPSPLIPLVRRSSHSAENHVNECKEHYDVIIVGGGGAGISLAGAIGKRQFICFGTISHCYEFFHFAAKTPMLSEKRVLLLDGAPKHKGYDANIYSNRVFSINRNTVKLLEQIGAWETIKSIRCRPVKQMQVGSKLHTSLTYRDR